MKGIIGKIKPGSSKTGTEAAEAAKAAKAKADQNAKNIKAVKAFVGKVGTLVGSTSSTGTADIRDLAKKTGPAIFSVEIGGAVQNFWVGAQDSQDDQTVTNKVRFAAENRLYEPKVKIPSAAVVRTIQADKLDIRGSNGNLVSFRFKREDYTSVDLNQPARCLFVLTSQLTGCSFVIGYRGTSLYMGHAQRKKGTVFADDGEQVAASLKLKRKTMFQDVENLESTFLVGAGSQFKIDELEGRITYNVNDSYVNVLGLVCNGKFYCILATKSGQDKIKNVVLVTLDTSTKKWKTEEMPKTWSD